MAPKQLILKTTETGCVVPVSHKLNKDGYFRRLLPTGKHVMWHRYVWEELNGPIPEGYEIDHLCRNRACCNPSHLQCIDGSEHASKTNRERSPQVALMKAYWLEHKCTGTELGKVFGISFGTACKHIRNWKSNK